MTRSKREIAYRTAGALILAAAVVPWATSGTAMAGGTEGNVTKCNPNDSTGAGNKPADVPGQTIPKSDITYSYVYEHGDKIWLKITAVDPKWDVTGLVIKAGNGYETYTPENAKEYNELGNLPWVKSGPGKWNQAKQKWIKQEISHWFLCGTPKGTTPTPCPTVTVTETQYVTQPPVTVTKRVTKKITKTAWATETVTEPAQEVTVTTEVPGPEITITDTFTVTPDPITTTATIPGPETTVVETITLTPDPITTTAISTVRVTDTVTAEVEVPVTETATVTETVTATDTVTATESATETATESATETATATETSTVLVSQTDSIQAVDPTDSSTEVAVLGTKAPGVAGGDDDPSDVLADTGVGGMTTKLVLSGALLMIGFALFAAPELLGAARTNMGRRH